MMNICRYHQHLFAYLHGELQPQLKKEVRAHIATCPSCNNELAALKDFKQQIFETATPLSAAHQRLLFQRIQAEIEESHPAEKGSQGPWRRYRLHGAVAAAAIVCFALLWALVPHSPQQVRSRAKKTLAFVPLHEPPRQLLLEEQLIQTVLLSAPDGREDAAAVHVVAAAGSQMTLQQDQSGAQIDMGQGSAWFQFENPGRTKRLAISTKWAQVDVIGTIFKIVSTDEQVRISVAEGTVAVISLDGTAEYIQAGYSWSTDSQGIQELRADGPKLSEAAPLLAAPASLHSTVPGKNTTTTTVHLEPKTSSMKPKPYVVSVPLKESDAQSTSGISVQRMQGWLENARKLFAQERIERSEQLLSSMLYHYEKVGIDNAAEHTQLLHIKSDMHYLLSQIAIKRRNARLARMHLELAASGSNETAAIAAYEYGRMLLKRYDRPTAARIYLRKFLASKVAYDLADDVWLLICESHVKEQDLISSKACLRDVINRFPTEEVRRKAKNLTTTLELNYSH